MKITSVTLTAVALLTPFLFAAEKAHEGHDHDDHSEKSHDHAKKIAGPNGGRILTGTEPHAEFFVMPDRRVKVTFIDPDGKAITPGVEVISAVSGKTPATVPMEFLKEGDAFVSDKPLPEGEAVPIVLQIKIAPDADNVTEEFDVALSECAECTHLTYACTCGH